MYGNNYKYNLVVYFVAPTGFWFELAKAYESVSMIQLVFVPSKNLFVGK
jgi:hypothetical protein